MAEHIYVAFCVECNGHVERFDHEDDRARYMTAHRMLLHHDSFWFAEVGRDEH